MSLAGSRVRSFVAEANLPGCGFPLENLPFCVFAATSSREWGVGVGIGSKVLGLKQLLKAGLLADLGRDISAACCDISLNRLFALEGGPAAVREHLSQLLSESSTAQAVVRDLLVEQADVSFEVPFTIGDYTDFFASVNHATNVGKMYRPDTPLLPNFKTQPLAYHGRASTVLISGEPVQRPSGNYRQGHGGDLIYAATAKLDFEVEIGVYIGRANQRNQPIELDAAESHIAGMCVVNDWSARDIQAWETQPLGPFLGKNFATSVSPWVVTLDALEAFRSPNLSQSQGEAPLSSYLQSDRNALFGGLAIQIETTLQTASMRENGIAPEKISTARFDRDSYWSVAQMVAHHTINGCNLRTGDLLASGTLSGPDFGSEGCLLELTRGGSEPLRLGNGEIRSYLEDGDQVSIHAFCQNENGIRIGFGSSHALVTSAQPIKEMN